MVGAWIRDHDESLRKVMPKALTSVTNVGSQLMQASLPPGKGGQCSCIVGNPVQCGVPEYHQKALKQPVNREGLIIDLPFE